MSQWVTIALSCLGSLAVALVTAVKLGNWKGSIDEVLKQLVLGQVTLDKHLEKQDTRLERHDERLVKMEIKVEHVDTLLTSRAPAE